MSLLRFCVELEVGNSTKFSFGTINYNEYLKNDYEGNIFILLYFEMSKLIEKRMKFEVDQDKDEILKQISLWKKAPMIQIKYELEGSSKKEESICCPFFIADPSNFILQEDAGNEHMKLLNQGKEVLELDPQNIYTFTLKKRGNFYC